MITPSLHVGSVNIFDMVRSAERLSRDWNPILRTISPPLPDDTLHIESLIGNGPSSVIIQTIFVSFLLF